MNPYRPQRGYTLLEVVVAFAILSLSLGALFESFSMTLRRLDKSRELSRAELLSESLYARLGVDLPLDSPKQDGAEAGCSWHVITRPQQRTDLDHPPTEIAVQASLDVICGSGRSAGTAHLDTVALSPTK